MYKYITNTIIEVTDDDLMKVVPFQFNVFINTLHESDVTIYDHSVEIEGGDIYYHLEDEVVEHIHDMYDELTTAFQQKTGYRLYLEDLLNNEDGTLNYENFGHQDYTFYIKLEDAYSKNPELIKYEELLGRQTDIKASIFSTDFWFLLFF